MDRVLIAYAASAGEIALVVGEQLCRAGLGVDVRAFGRAGAPDNYEAVVVGSTVRDGHWAAEATEYLSRYAATLAERPLWLYESTERGAPSTTEDGLVRFGPDDLPRARDWGFTLGCRLRPLTASRQV